MITIPRRAATALACTAVVTVLLFSFKTPDQSLVATTVPSVAIVDGSGAGSTGATATRRPTSTAGSNGSTATATPAPAAAGGTTEVTGPTVSTRFGPVQVQLEISGGRLQDVVAVQLPSGGRSGRISVYAEAILHQEALSAKSASIDAVSGATYTSRAYAQSLQAALDKAGI